MSFKDRFKGFVEGVSKKLSLSGTEVQQMAKAYSRYIKTESQCINDFNTSIVALKIYTENEAQILTNELNTLANVFNSLISIRTERLDRSRSEILPLLQEMLNGYSKILDKVRESEDAKKAVEKVEKIFMKKQVRSKDTHGPENALNAARKNLKAKEAEADQSNEIFHKLKIEKLSEILKNFLIIEESYINKSVEIITKKDLASQHIYENEMDF